MKVPVLGSIEDLTIEEWGYAGYKSLPDKMSSCSGQVIIIKDSLSNTSMVVNWKRRKLRRIVNTRFFFIRKCKFGVSLTSF